MAEVINTSTELSSYTQRTILDGREYLLTFQWNQREEKWYLSIADQDGDPLGQGIKVVANFPLNRALTDIRSPPGILYAMDRTGQGCDPLLRELGDRVLLIYITEAELAAAATG